MSLATYGHSYLGDPVRLILCLALVGGILGFLPLNRHPAKIFMGDAGSMLLGFVAGSLMILFTERIGRWSVGAIIIFGLPILDTAVALARRFINKKPLFVSDRGHIYDQIHDRTGSLKKTLKICYLLAIIYALICGLLVWIVDAALNNLFLGGGSFWNQLVAASPQAMFLRILILVGSLVVGPVIGGVIARREAA